MKRRWLPLTHSWFKFVMTDDGSGYRWVKKRVGVTPLVALAWQVYVTAKRLTGSMGFMA